MLHLFHTVSADCSRIITKRYSTSFFSAIGLLHKELRQPIFNIYGFVRLADEIVDTFHDYDKSALLEQFRRETYEALDKGISLNPVLNSFQQTVNDYQVDRSLIHAFFESMEMDLSRQVYDCDQYRNYIFGSAEAVGLMCLRVFCEGRSEIYEQLCQPARALGSAFQKVNFLRDMKMDYNGLSRMYFPGCDFNNFTCVQKLQIEEDIQQDFRSARQGILNLPLKARFGVYVAYKYYLSLFKKIKKMEPKRILQQRIRIPNYYKMMIILKATVENQFKLI